MSRNATERHFDELKAAGEQLPPDDGRPWYDLLCTCTGAEGDTPCEHHRATEPLDAREAVRQLHVMYGIAMTKKLREDYDYIRSVYGQLASDIHRVLLGITNENEVEMELRWLADTWGEVSRTSDGRTAALFGSWAQSVEGMIR